MKYWVDGCTSKRHQERERLAIIHVRGDAFCFLMSLLFYVFLLFASYGIWCVVIHGMSMFKLEVGGGMLLPGFFLLVRCGICVREKKKVLGEGRR
jgi:hypothetical protein